MEFIQFKPSQDETISSDKAIKVLPMGLDLAGNNAQE